MLLWQALSSSHGVGVYRSRRIIEIERDLPGVLEALATVEANVLVEVQAMRPTTGRVPWPKSLPPFEGRITRGLNNQQRNIDAEPARVAAHRARLHAQSAREMAKLDELSQREEEAERRRFASLPPAQQEAERAEIRMFRQVLEERGLSIKDIFGGLGVSDTFYEVEREVSARVARRESGD